MSSRPVREPLVGWRIWRVVDSELHAVVWGHTWEPHARFEAECADRPSPFWEPNAPDAPRHAAPAPGCECGVYAFKSRDDAELLAREKVDGDVIALGRVSLWGRVIESERGYRGQYAYPYELVLLGGTDAVARDLRARYAVDVELAPTVAQLHAGAG